MPDQDLPFAEALSKLWPNAPAATIAAIKRVCDEVFRDYEIDTPLRLAHFMAQISHECGAGTIVRENMNYSAQRMLEIFGVGVHSAKVTPAEAKAAEHQPKLVAERVYGLGNPKKAAELGNTEPGDGYRFRGNGMLQLTGRASHKRIGDMTGFDLEGDPEQLQDPAISFRVAAAEFKALKCLDPADTDDVVLVTRRVNGGRNGLAERTVWLRKWKQHLAGVEAPAWTPRAAPSADVKPIMSTKIAQGSAIGGGLATVTAIGQLAQTFKAVSDTTDTAKNISDNTTSVVSAVKPLFALPLSMALSLIAIGAVVAFGYVFWKRYRKMQDEGV